MTDTPTRADLIERLREPMDTELRKFEQHYDEERREAAKRITALKGEVERLREALGRMVYETTHLSPMKPNGDHDCTIKADTLAQARAALKGTDHDTV